MQPSESRDSWDSAELERAGALAREVRASAGADTALCAVRAPGRVNLIGEHTDYSGLPVLPVAIDRSTIVVGAPRSGFELAVHNSDSTYPPRRFRIEQQIPSYPAGDWANYIKAAVQGVIDHFSAGGMAPARFRGATFAVEGRVPTAAGLSSSAALTVSSALAFMAVNHLSLPPIEAAQMVARSEWYVGTRAGGMDQAASLLGQRDHALFIEFNPLRVRRVKMPPDAALVVADSLEIADKAGKVRNEYNRRVVECSLAARILASTLHLDDAAVLGDVVRQLDKWNAHDLTRTLADAAPAELSADLIDAARILGITPDALGGYLLGRGGRRIAIDRWPPLRILARTRHVLGETNRVLRAVEALEAGRLDEMGALMNASHESLRIDFECSTARLDKMVGIARGAGALGARLTGAGFGGSIVALCHAGATEAVIEALDRDYYAHLSPGPHFENARAVLHASAGADVIELAA